MSTMIGMVSILMLLFAVVIASRHRDDRGGTARREALVKLAREKWAAETDLDALGLLYGLVVKRMYQLKHQDKPFDYLISDANLILEIRNSIIENGSWGISMTLKASLRRGSVSPTHRRNSSQFCVPVSGLPSLEC